MGARNNIIELYRKQKSDAIDFFKTYIDKVLHIFIRFICFSMMYYSQMPNQNCRVGKAYSGSIAIRYNVAKAAVCKNVLLNKSNELVFSLIVLSRKVILYNEISLKRFLNSKQKYR